MFNPKTAEEVRVFIEEMKDKPRHLSDAYVGLSWKIVSKDVITDSGEDYTNLLQDAVTMSLDDFKTDDLALRYHYILPALGIILSHSNVVDALGEDKYTEFLNKTLNDTYKAASECANPEQEKRSVDEVLVNRHLINNRSKIDFLPLISEKIVQDRNLINLATTNHILDANLSRMDRFLSNKDETVKENFAEKVNSEVKNRTEGFVSYFSVLCSTKEAKRDYSVANIEKDIEKLRDAYTRTHSKQTLA